MADFDESGTMGADNKADLVKDATNVADLPEASRSQKMADLKGARLNL
jgi:hypothetical protein